MKRQPSVLGENASLTKNATEQTRAAAQVRSGRGALIACRQTSVRIEDAVTQAAVPDSAIEDEADYL